MCLCWLKRYIVYKAENGSVITLSLFVTQLLPKLCSFLCNCYVAFGRSTVWSSIAYGLFQTSWLIQECWGCCVVVVWLRTVGRHLPTLPTSIAVVHRRRRSSTLVDFHWRCWTLKFISLEENTGFGKEDFFPI